MIKRLFGVVFLCLLTFTASAQTPVDTGDESARVDTFFVVDGKSFRGSEMPVIDPSTIISRELVTDVNDSRRRGLPSKYPLVWITTNNPLSEDDVLDRIDKLPEFPGGIDALMRFLSNSVKYPHSAQLIGMQGRIVVTFVVNRDGSVGDVAPMSADIKTSKTDNEKQLAKLKKKNNYSDEEAEAEYKKIQLQAAKDLRAEALRVVRAMPNWKPGMQDGRLVRVKYNIPVNFRLK